MSKLLIAPAVLAVALCLPTVGTADGLITQLPEDGAWARFEVNGKGIAPDGTVKVTVQGTQTIRSVGRTTVDNEECRWIELELQITFQRTGKQAEKFNELMKLLVPEKNLIQGENPRAHVIKAYKGTSAKAIRQLDLKGNGAREIESLDELFHAPLKELSRLAAAMITVGQEDWTCEGFKAEAKTDGTVFRTETRLNKKAPFGVVTYTYEKERIQNNATEGTRTMEWKLLEFGKDAKSAAPDAN